MKADGSQAAAATSVVSNTDIGQMFRCIGDHVASVSQSVWSTERQLSSKRVSAGPTLETQLS